MSTSTQDRDFGVYFLDDIKDWIGRNLNPDDVFDEKTLKEWALDNGFVEEDSIDYEDWANKNGYVLEE